MNRITRFLLVTLALAGFSSCINIFDPIDNPSGDMQLLSAARAAFDQGEYTQAREYYGKLANNEQARAEEAFMTLDQEGLGTDALIIAVSRAKSGSIGEILTNMAEAAAQGENTTPGQTKRTNLVTAYRKIAEIQNTELRGFVQFVVGIALSAEIFAEQTGVSSDKIFNKNDFAANGTTCSGIGAGCAGSATCDQPAGGLSAGTGNPVNDYLSTSSNWSSATLTGSPTLSMLYSALKAASDGMNAIGVTQGSSYDLLTQILAVTAPSGVAAVDRCFTSAILATGAGR